MGNTEFKWYEKASGKKPRKPENIEKLKLKGEVKKAEKNNKASAEKSFHKKNFSQTLTDSKILSLFNTEKIPAESKAVLENFGKIVSDTEKLSLKQQTLLPEKIKQLSHLLTDDRGDRRLGYMNDASFVSAYINYFQWWNLVRLVNLFSNLPAESFPVEDGDSCLDIGSGPLTIPISLWLARPELRTKKITFYCMDLSQNILAAGEEIFYSICAKTIKNGQQPWKIVRIKGTGGTQLRTKPVFIACGNVLNERAQNSQKEGDFLSKKFTEEIISYFDKDDNSRTKTVLIVEPGDPHSARLVSLMRSALIKRNFLPLSPCPHYLPCPMEGRTKNCPDRKWCNFAFSTGDSPASLLKLSEKSKLKKDRAVLSFVLAQKKAVIKTDAEGKKTSDLQTSFFLRVASDLIYLPEMHSAGYYCCTNIGLVLAINKSRRKIKNGDLICSAPPKDIKGLSTDKKTSALIIEI